jgi:hypothetical protein
VQNKNFSISEAASVSGLPAPSIRALVTAAVLQPTVHRAEGTGSSHLFALRDLVAARVIHALRLPAETSPLFRNTAAIWQSDDGARCIDRALHGDRPGRPAQYLVGTPDRATLVGDVSLHEVVRLLNATTLHVVDVGRLIHDVFVHATEQVMLSPVHERPRRRRKPHPDSATAPEKRADLKPRSASVGGERLERHRSTRKAKPSPSVPEVAKRNSGKRKP